MYHQECPCIERVQGSSLLPVSVKRKITLLGKHLNLFQVIKSFIILLCPHFKCNNISSIIHYPAVDNGWMDGSTHLIIHPCISFHLSGVGSRGQQPKQGRPDIPLPSYFVQLSWGNPRPTKRHSPQLALAPAGGT